MKDIMNVLEKGVHWFICEWRYTISLYDQTASIRRIK